MENSKIKSQAPGFILLALFLAAAGIVYAFQYDRVVRTEGLYPEVMPPPQGEFSFGPDQVVIKLSREPLLKRIVVYAYDPNGWQVGIIKPVYDRTITLNKGEYPDYRVEVKSGQTGAFEIFNKQKQAVYDEDFIGLLKRAKEISRPFGLQECLFPFCTQCLDVCPVVKAGVIVMRVDPKGLIYPVIDIQGCPRCGKCFFVCKPGTICKLAIPHIELDNKGIKPSTGSDVVIF